MERWECFIQEYAEEDFWVHFFFFFSLPSGSLKEAHIMIQGNFSTRVLWIYFLLLLFILRIDYSIYRSSQLAKIINWQLFPGPLSYAQNCAGQSQGSRKGYLGKGILRTVGDQSSKLWHRLQVSFFTFGIQQRENPSVIKQTREGGT